MPIHAPMTGILLANTGTPAAPTPQAVRRYLAEFLSDRRIVELPPALWLPVLYGIILLVRPRRSARLYQRVWTAEGAPLLVIMRRLEAALRQRLETETGQPARLEIGMRYGQPSIAAGLRRLAQAGAERLLVLPLFPQYSATTSGSIMDAVFAELRTWRHIPAVRTISDYHTHPAYIAALSRRLCAEWAQDEQLTPAGQPAQAGPPAHSLFSFHGIPASYAAKGDPYPQQCRATAALTAAALGLPDDAWSVSFQSRFGPQPWLQPYTDEVLTDMGRQGLDGLHVACPGFAIDCLETLDEIGHEGRHTFTAAGGGRFHYSPALNDSPEQLDLLTNLICQNL